MNNFGDAVRWLMKSAKAQVPWRLTVAFFLSIILGLTILTVSVVGPGIFSITAPG